MSCGWYLGSDLGTITLAGFGDGDEAHTGDKDPNTHQTHAGYIGSTDNK